MQRHIYLLFLLLLLATTQGKAQPSILQHLSVEDGLSNNYVSDLVQDKRGHIWIATESGLNRFNGKVFTVYDAQNSTLENNALTTLLYDPADDQLWIGSQSGMYRMNCSTQKIERFVLPDSIILGNITSLSFAADSGIWIANHYGRIVHYNRKNQKATVYSGNSFKGLQASNWCVFDDGQGYLYVGHNQGGLSIINLSSHSVNNFQHDPNNSNSLPGNSVYSIYIDHFENIWIGTNRGLALYNPQKEEFTNFHHEPQNPHSLISDHIYKIKEMNGTELWIASDIGGISILNLRDLTLTNPAELRFRNIAVTYDEYGLSSGNIRSLLQDSFGNIWIGNYSSGIDFISHTQPAFYTLPYTVEQGRGHILKNKSVWAIYADEEQQIWVGSKNELALFKEGKLQKSFNLTKYMSRSYAQVFSIIAQEESLLLGLYDDGLLRLNLRNNHIERIPLEKENIDVNTFYKDDNGKIWIGTEDGLYSYIQDTIRKEKEISDQIGNLSAYGIVRDGQGKLWIGLYGAGICILDRNNKEVARIKQDKGLCSNIINQLYKDSKGSIWVATRNGISYFADTEHPESFENFGYQQNLKDIYVRAIHEDKSGNIWVSTNSGISFWNKQLKRFENYDHRDGIPSENFTDGSVCSTANGTLYFGSLNGVCYFNPKNLIRENQLTSAPVIECKGLKRQIEHRNEEVLISTANGSTYLPYNENSFRISFSVPDYSQNGLVEYAYMIEGLEGTWTNTLGENIVTFRNITPGSYTFKVKARLRNQEWDDSHIASIKIHIYPPFWLTWYAKAFYVLLASVGIFFWFRFYKRKLVLETSLELERKKSQNEQELNNERLRFYTNITHELRTPLTLILGPLEDLINDSNLPALYSNKIKMIHSSALRLLNLINQILEFRKTETQNRKLTVSMGDLSSLVTETGLRYKELNRNNKVKIHINIETKDTKLYFDADIISAILNNLLSNAMKYTPEGEIRLSMRSIIEEENLYTEITVADTGYGIDAEALPQIFDRYYQAKGKHQASGTGIGLALVKSLTDLHEGTLHVESEIGKGATFTFRLFTKNTYPDALHREEKLDVIKEELETVEEEKVDIDIRPMILVVEDNNDIREYIATSFSENFRIITANNGQEGVEQALEYIPDIIISDIMMPVMDGIELCKLVKENICTSHIPVILLTAKDSIQDKEEGYESGADSYLTKPFSAKLLNSRVHNLLESRKKLVSLIASRTKELKPTQPQETMILNKLDEEFLNKLTGIIEDKIDSAELDMAFLTDKVHMSHSTLYRKIKGLTGISGNEFIRNTKLKYSLRLLTEGNMNISEAAYASGFNDLGYFRNCFKEEYGMSPSEYIRQQR